MLHFGKHAQLAMPCQSRKWKAATTRTRTFPRAACCCLNVAAPSPSRLRACFTLTHQSHQFGLDGKSWWMPPRCVVWEPGLGRTGEIGLCLPSLPPCTACNEIVCVCVYVHIGCPHAQHYGATLCECASGRARFGGAPWRAQGRDGLGKHGALSPALHRTPLAAGSPHCTFTEFVHGLNHNAWI